MWLKTSLTELCFFRLNSHLSDSPVSQSKATLANRCPTDWLYFKHSWYYHLQDPVVFKTNSEQVQLYFFCYAAWMDVDCAVWWDMWVRIPRCVATDQPQLCRNILWRSTRMLVKDKSEKGQQARQGLYLSFSFLLSDVWSFLYGMHSIQVMPTMTIIYDRRFTIA